MRHVNHTPTNRRLPWWAALILLALLGATLHLMTHGQTPGGSVTGALFVILAVHFGLAAAILGAFQWLRRRIAGQGKSAEAPTPEITSVFAEVGNGAAQDELAAVGGRLLSWFRVQISHSMQRNDAEHREQIHDRLHGVVDEMAGYLDRLQEDGRIQLPDTRAAAALFVSAIHSLAAVEVIGHASVNEAPDMAHAVPLFSAALWNGLKP